MLQSKLEDSFRHGLKTGDKRTLTQSLQTYASIGRFQAAEAFFQVYIVHPYMDKVSPPNPTPSNPTPSTLALVRGNPLTHPLTVCMNPKD